MSQGVYGAGNYGAGVYPSLVGASTSSGALTLRATHRAAFTGASATSGTLTPHLLTYRATFAGASTASGDVAEQVQHHRLVSIGGASTSAGTVDLTVLSFYRRRRPMTVSHALVAGALTNFPVTVADTFGFLRGEAYGGHVTNASGFDIAFYADQALTIPLAWDVEQYDRSSGAFVAWVRIPTLSPTVDTVFWLAYEQTVIGSYQGGGRGAAFPATLEAAYHFAGDGAGGFSMADATANALDATGTAAAVAGQIDGGVYVEYVSEIDAPVPEATSGSPAISFWLTQGQPWNSDLVDKTLDPNAYATHDFDIWRGQNYVMGGNYNDGIIRFGFIDAGGTQHRIDSPVAEPVNTWAYFVAVWGAGGMHLYRNGQEVAADATTAYHRANAAPYHIGLNAPNVRTRTSTFDEVHFWTAAPTPAWIQTEYNNQLAPSAFVAPGNLTVVLPLEGGSSSSGTLRPSNLRRLSLAGASTASGTLTTTYHPRVTQAVSGASTASGTLATVKHGRQNQAVSGASTSSGAFTPIKFWNRLQVFGGQSGSSGDMTAVYWPVAPPKPYIRRYRAEITLSSLTDRTPWQIAEQLSTALGCDFTVYAGRVATWRERQCPNPPDYRVAFEDLASYEPDELDLFTRLIATYTDPHTRERGRTEEFIDHDAENRYGVQLLAVRDAGSVVRSYANAWAQQQLATGGIPTVRATLGPVAGVDDWYFNPIEGPHVRATQWVHIETKAPLMIMSTSLDSAGHVTLQLGERQLTPAADQASLRRQVNQFIRQTSANTGGPA